MSEVRRKVTIAEGRATCTVTEFDDDAVIVEASYDEHLVDEPKGRVFLHVSAPDRTTARKWCDAMLHALRQTTQGTLSG